MFQGTKLSIDFIVGTIGIFVYSEKKINKKLGIYLCVYLMPL